MNKELLKIILVHGNGGGRATDHWFPSLKKSLEKLGLKVIARDFPDPDLARSEYWLPFLKNELNADQNTIIIGHSSGAVAAMKYSQKNRIYGSILVGVNYTDLGDNAEKQSGYYDEPWDWKKIRSNQNWIIQYSSIDDPYIPISEPRFIHKMLHTEYYEYTDKDHFMIPEFHELLGGLKKKLSIG